MASEGVRSSLDGWGTNVADEEIDKGQIVALKSIHENKGRVSNYALYKKLKIPMSDFMKLIFELRQENLVMFDGDWLSITSAGVSLLHSFRPTSDKKTKNLLPKNMARPYQLNPNDAYVPSRSKFDQSLLKN